MIIRKLFEGEIQEAISLVIRVFMEFEAPEYSVEGVKSFKKDIENDSFLRNIVMYGAFDGDVLAGVAATRNEGTHIALLFVESDYQRQGIGRKFFDKILQDCHNDKITVNSSPYAVAVYKKLGFSATSKEQTLNGIRFTPMLFLK